jgi:hypothetical protein
VAVGVLRDAEGFRPDGVAIGVERCEIAVGEDGVNLLKCARLAKMQE